MEDLKAHWSKFVKGGIAGAVLVLIAGFAFGPLTTNGSATELVSAAIAKRDISYCVVNAQKLVDVGDQVAPTNSTERTNLAKASFASLLPDVSISNSIFRSCSRAFPKEF